MSISDKKNKTSINMGFFGLVFLLAAMALIYGIDIYFQLPKTAAMSYINGFIIILATNIGIIFGYFVKCSWFNFRKFI